MEYILNFVTSIVKNYPIATGIVSICAFLFLTKPSDSCLSKSIGNYIISLGEKSEGATYIAKMCDKKINNCMIIKFASVDILDKNYYFIGICQFWILLDKKKIKRC